MRTLEDDTGEIGVADYGACDGDGGSMTVYPPLLDRYPVSIGDRVTTRVMISQVFSSNFAQSQIGAALGWIERLPPTDGFR